MVLVSVLLGACGGVTDPGSAPGSGGGGEATPPPTVVAWADTAGDGLWRGAADLSQSGNQWTASVDVSDTGSTLFHAYVVDGTQAGHADGTFQDGTRLDAPQAITTDGRYLYVADTGNHVIRGMSIRTGELSTLAGSPGNDGSADSSDGTGATARFDPPAGKLANDEVAVYSDYWIDIDPPIGEADDVAEKTDAPSEPEPVAGLQANELGLYDMSGNVWEWTVTNNGWRVYRGGPYTRNSFYLMVGRTSSKQPDTTSTVGTGLRLVRTGD